jgi:hypothetical protein
MECKAKYYKGTESGQEKLKAYGYHFNDKGEFTSLDNNSKYLFSTQKVYDETGKQILLFVQKEILEKQLHMVLQKGVGENDYVYVSSDFYTNKGGCLIMVQGSGAARPGYLTHPGFGRGNAASTKDWRSAP